MLTDAQEISRRKAAISRNTPSRLVKLALADDLVNPETPLFDYGCGRGDDLHILSAMGYCGSGRNAVHRPSAPHIQRLSLISGTLSTSSKIRSSAIRRCAARRNLLKECLSLAPA
jgi:hypothetical protein